MRLEFEGGAAVLSPVVVGGRISHLYAVNNPHKLGWVATRVALRR